MESWPFVFVVRMTIPFKRMHTYHAPNCFKGILNKNLSHSVLWVLTIFLWEKCRLCCLFDSSRGDCLSGNLVRMEDLKTTTRPSNSIEALLLIWNSPISKPRPKIDRCQSGWLSQRNRMNKYHIGIHVSLGIMGSQNWWSGDPRTLRKTGSNPSIVGSHDS